MNTFKSSRGGDSRNRSSFIGGRPKSDADYGPKKSFGKKPFGGRDEKRGSKFGGDRGGRGGFGGSRDNDRREMEMYKASCSNCSKSCEVPFRPNGEKPVFCNDCFAQNRSSDRSVEVRRDRFSEERPQRSFERKFDAPRGDQVSGRDIKALAQQVTALENKVNEILSLLKEVPAKAVAPVEESAEVVSEKKVAKKVAAKKAPAKEAIKKVTKKVAKK